MGHRGHVHIERGNHGFRTQLLADGGKSCKVAKQNGGRPLLPAHGQGIRIGSQTFNKLRTDSRAKLARDARLLTLVHHRCRGNAGSLRGNGRKHRHRHRNHQVMKFKGPESREKNPRASDGKCHCRADARPRLPRNHRTDHPEYRPNDPSAPRRPEIHGLTRNDHVRHCGMKIHTRSPRTIDGIDHVRHDPRGNETNKYQSTLKAIAGFLCSRGNLLARRRDLLVKSPPFTVRTNLLSLSVSGVLDVASTAH